ncbi:hypothetical protein [Tenacibaculum sp. 190524A05c]|uniref:hypothetical protein n=1 Tax=Tenacibaculum platacis TaxID=3137852 RepID=UPI0032B1B59D
MNIKNTFIIVLILTLFSCSKLTKENSKFIYSKGEHSIELKILNGNNHLTFDTPLRADFEWKNINPKTGSIYGAGIRILGTENGVTKTEINIPSKYFQLDTLNIKLLFEIKGEKTTTEFNIPIKYKQE